MLVALLSDRPVALCEPRKRRAAFLERAAAALDIADRVTIAATKVQAVSGRFAVISARAVAALPDLFSAACHNAGRATVWVLAKGRSARARKSVMEGESVYVRVDTGRTRSYKKKK